MKTRLFLLCALVSATLAADLPYAGKWKVNKKDIKDYFHSEALVIYIEQPIKLTNTLGKFDITACVSGGGISGRRRSTAARSVAAASRPATSATARSGTARSAAGT